MFEAETEVIQLESRLGRVGSIQAWDPWKSRRSIEDMKWWVARVASLSYGNEEAKNPEALFSRLLGLHHLAVLEFVPRSVERSEGDGSLHALPYSSLRSFQESIETGNWNAQLAKACSKMWPCFAFLVECPLYTRSQWMRHRSFAYLEMSRRYTKGSKVAWEYYGHNTGDREEDSEPKVNLFHRSCEAEYQRRLDAGWPNEIARGCMPMEGMTKFWVAGFERDWMHFLELRDEAHAQPEIRVFAQWIRTYTEGKQNGFI